MCEDSTRRRIQHIFAVLNVIFAGKQGITCGVGIYYCSVEMANIKILKCPNRAQVSRHQKYKQRDIELNIKAIKMISLRRILTIASHVNVERTRASDRKTGLFVIKSEIRYT